MFNKKSILITGGTGSFGKKFTEYLLNKYKPKRLVIYSRDELKQYEMSLNYSKKKFANIRYFIGDIRDSERLKFAMKDIDIVIHAAALKQVPAAEYNPMECIKTNVFGAENLINACFQNNVKNVIALSTDKAASPINLYGASKLVSDKYFIAANNITGKFKTKFSVVRYGNVIGSRGSVVPQFKNIIKQKNKFIPITHKDMTRFWISLDQAIKFVDNCFKRMKGGEIFVPKIPSVRIVDLAKAMAPYINPKITGIRPGEKIHEVMLTNDDARLSLEFKDHYVIMPTILFKDHSNSFVVNNLKEKGKAVIENFSYNSKNNVRFLNIKQIKDSLKNI